MFLDIRTIRELIRQELLPLSQSMRPGGEFELDGYDPDYSTNPARKTETLELSQQHSTLEDSVSPYETVNFTFTLDLESMADDKRVGIIIKAPSPQSGSNFEVNGKQFGTFNSSVGRFRRGVLTVNGVLYNGARGGILGIAFGAPADAEETDIGEFESREGTETIDLSAGFWLVTWQIEQNLDLSEPIDDIPYQLAEVNSSALVLHSEAWLLPWEGDE